MILRSLTKHVKDQNWFAVGLDFAIVVIGVFIGIQVANWNDVQVDKRLGRQYMDRLVVDLRNDLSTYTAQQAYFEQVLGSIEEADRLLEENNPDPEALVVAAYRASETANTVSNTATWDQMVSSGHIGLLRNLKLERGLAEYYKYQRDTGTRRLFDSTYRQTVRSLIPLAVQLAIREGCSDKLDPKYTTIGFVPECVVDAHTELLGTTAQAIRTSRIIRETLRAHYSAVAIATYNSSGNVAQIEELLEALALVLTH